MTERKQYWPDPRQIEAPIILEYRASFAWDLLKHWGTVAAKADGEDSAGRSKLVLQEPKAIVERAFAIADAFVDTAESRGEVRAQTLTLEDVAAAKGRLQRIGWDREMSKKE